MTRESCKVDCRWSVIHAIECGCRTGESVCCPLSSFSDWVFDRRKGERLLRVHTLVSHVSVALPSVGHLLERTFTDDVLRARPYIRENTTQQSSALEGIKQEVSREAGRCKRVVWREKSSKREVGRVI